MKTELNPYFESFLSRNSGKTSPFSSEMILKVIKGIEMGKKFFAQRFYFSGHEVIIEIRDSTLTNVWRTVSLVSRNVEESFEVKLKTNGNASIERFKSDELDYMFESFHEYGDALDILFDENVRKTIAFTLKGLKKSIAMSSRNIKHSDRNKVNRHYNNKKKQDLSLETWIAILENELK